MHRRSLLHAVGATLAAGCTSPVRAGEDPFEPRSHVPLAGAKEAVVGGDGRTAYVAVTDGFATVDLSDPAAPRVLAERRTLLPERERGPMERINDVAVDGDRLAVAGPANGTGLGGVLLFDVADPADPRSVAFHEVPWPVHNCDIADGAVYLTANNGDDSPVVVVDVSDDEPREVARWSLLDHDEAWSDVHLGARPIHDVTAVDGVAYCAYWDAGTWLLDVSDPTSPALLGHVGGFTREELLELSDTEKGYQTLEPPGNAHYAEVSDDGTVLAVGGESWDGRPDDGHGGPSGIDLWDVSDPAEPEHLSSIEPFVPGDATREGVWTTAHNFELAGGRLYSAWYQDGVKLHDVSEPARPEQLAHWRDPDRTRFWTARVGRRGEFFVGADMGSRGENGEDAGLYCFPDRSGTQRDQPPIETPTESPTATATGTPTPGSSPETPSPTATSTRSESPPASTDLNPAVTTPGFGAVVALGGLGVAALRALRRCE